MDIDLNAEIAVARPTGRRFVSAALGALGALALATGPALAQKVPVAPPPALPPAAFADGYAACMAAAADITAAEAALTAAGWTIDEAAVEGPFSRTLSASKTDAVNGDTYFYAVVETYLTLALVYCSYEIEGVVGEVDFTAAPAELGLDGGVELTEGGVYGAWERLDDEGGVLILADQEGDYFYFQVNIVVVLAEASAPPPPSIAVPPPRTK